MSVLENICLFSLFKKKKTERKNMDWSFIEKAYCISLRDNEQSRQEFLAQCAEIGLEVEMVIVDLHKDGGKRGCFESHMDVLQKSMEYSNVLVFEDDARFFKERMTPETVAAVKKSLEAVDWDLVYFGYMPYPMSSIDVLPDHPHLAKCSRGWMSHAYLASNKLIHHLLAQRKDFQHYDAYLHNHSDASTRFVVHPMLYYQDDRPGAVSATWLLSKVMSLGDMARTAEACSLKHHEIFWVFVSIILAVILLYLFCKKRYKS